MASLSVAGCAAEPPIKCTLSGGGAIAVYRPPTNKVEAKPGDCNADTLLGVGEPLGFETYQPRVDDPNAYNTPNSISIETNSLGELVIGAGGLDPAVADPNMDHPPYALGAFDPPFAVNDICSVSNLSTADITLPPHDSFPNPDSNDDTPLPPIAATTTETHVKYEWKNFKVVVSADSYGTQSFADLTYTHNGCKSDYSVSILWPLAGCETDTDCDPLPDPARGYFGSGIGVGVPTSCSKVLGVCVPTKTAP